MFNNTLGELLPPREAGDFVVTGIAAVTREAYGPGAGTVVLQLRGAPDAFVGLVYEFN